MRLRRRWLGRVLFAAAAAGAAGPAACIVVPPPDLPSTPEPPIILHASADPSAAAPLAEWPMGAFIVPVEFFGPNPEFVWSVFIDYDGNATTPYTSGGSVPTRAPDLDGGVYLLPIPLPPGGNPSSGLSPIDITRCHTIEVIVAHGFVQSPGNLVTNFHSWDSVGGDDIAWQYQPPGSNCATFDDDAGAGTIDDGATDSLSQPPPDGAR